MRLVIIDIVKSPRYLYNSAAHGNDCRHKCRTCHLYCGWFYISRALLLAVTSALYGLKVALIFSNIAKFLCLTKKKSFRKIKQTDSMKVEMILTVKCQGFTCMCVTQTSKCNIITGVRHCQSYVSCPRIQHGELSQGQLIPGMLEVD